jgi:hypothetical protein
MTAMIPLIVLASLATVFFIVVRVTKGGVPGLLTKTFASVCFIALGVAGALSLYPHIEKSAILILFGLVMGLIGDIVLDLKIIYPESNDLYLNSGMISFGVGHFLYLAAIILLISFNLNTLLVCIAITLPISALIMFASKLIKIHFGKFIVHAVLYTIILVFMSVYTIVLAIADTKLSLMAVGMVLFLLSDLVLSPMYFAGKQDDKFMCVANHTLYYAAQICIAAFIFFI